MKKLLRYLPLYFTACLILGICFQYYLKIWSFGNLKPVLVLLFLLGMLFVFRNKILRALNIFLLFVFLGICTVYFTNDTNYEAYYQHKITKNSYALLTISKVLKEGRYAYKYIAQVSQIDGVPSRGTVLLNLEKDSLKTTLQVDDYILLSANFKPIKSPLNPHQFNYKQYLARQGIHQQVFLKKESYKSLGKRRSSLGGISAIIRAKINAALQKHAFSENTLAIMNALLLGQRQDITNELRNDYANAGAIHILAVSGLHVGILLLLLNFLFKPIERIQHGKLIKMFLVVGLLWCFALIAGGSASVVRAVTMFSFVAVGLSVKRRKTITFSLISSAFLLLLVKPMFLFDVGFQLSYLAVFGIVWVQPKLANLFNCKYWIFRKIWSLCSVSIAAQMGVLPLSLYYFHQFPGLFFLSNVLIIPFLGAILMGGILVIILSLSNMLPNFIAVFYNGIIEVLNGLIHWISSKEAFLFQGISMSFLMMLVSYLFMIALFQVCVKFNAKNMRYCLLSLLLFQGGLLFENVQFSNKKEFIIFHVPRKSIYGVRKGKALFLKTKQDTDSWQEIIQIENYRVGEQLNFVERQPATNYFKIGNQDFLIVDSLGVYQVKGLKNPIVLLQNSPKINSTRLLQTLNPKQLIADGNNYTSYVKKWRSICDINGIPFHDTGAQGAYILKQ
jgi:competence protein ComEC